MKVLILGSTGVLGNSLKLFLKDKRKIKLFFVSRKKKIKSNYYLNNFSNFNKLEKIILQIKPNYIVNCLGVTKFHNEYNFKRTTKLLNTAFPIFLSKLCLREKIYFIHISTDCVFLGNKGNYLDDAKKDALDLYGLSKNKGEVKNKFSATLRTSFVGPELNSSKSLLNWFLSQKKNVYGFQKAYFSGLTSLELSKIIYKYYLKKYNYYNLILNVGGKKISKFNLLKIFANVFEKKIQILKNTSFKIDRSLNSSKFIKLTGYKPLKWVKLIKNLKSFMIKNNFNY